MVGRRGQAWSDAEYFFNEICYGKRLFCSPGICGDVKINCYGGLLQRYVHFL